MAVIFSCKNSPFNSGQNGNFFFMLCMLEVSSD